MSSGRLRAYEYVVVVAACIARKLADEGLWKWLTFYVRVQIFIEMSLQDVVFSVLGMLNGWCHSLVF